MTRRTTSRLTGWCAVLALTTASCFGSSDDDDEPAEDCVAVRKRYIAAKAMHDRAVSFGVASTEAEVALDLYVSEHWDCFR